LRGEEDFFVAEHVTANIICVFFVWLSGIICKRKQIYYCSW
jgi:hypothetical protein